MPDDAFGAHTLHTPGPNGIRGDGDDVNTPQAASAVGNPCLFTGRRYDPETGLYDYRARMYHPALGRFMQPDPIGYYDSMNLYQYCGNDPVNWIDPYGLTQDWKPVPEEKGWEYREEQHGPKDPQHRTYRYRGKQYARRVYKDKSQKRHGSGTDKDVPQRVIDSSPEEWKPKKYPEADDCPKSNEKNEINTVHPPHYDVVIPTPDPETAAKASFWVVAGGFTIYLLINFFTFGTAGG